MKKYIVTLTTEDLGAVNPNRDGIETVDEIVARAEAAAGLIGPDHVLLTTDWRSATFADNPLGSAAGAEAHLTVIARAARPLRRRQGAE